MVFGTAMLCVLIAAAQPETQPEAKPPPTQPASQSPLPASKPAPLKPPIPFPHPIITEVLYGVPSGADGDANKDGERSATGDEFIELVNPHDKPINLGGYMLTDGTTLDSSDRSPNARTQVRFVFPDLELQPGQVALVFNGYKQKIAGPLGDAAKPPTDPSPHFAGALVFSMKAPSQYVAFNNESDCVILRDPKGRAINAIRWGGYSGSAASSAVLSEEAPKGMGSVQRIGLSRQLATHHDLVPGVLFSPGDFDLTAQPQAPARTARPARATGKK